MALDKTKTDLGRRVIDIDKYDVSELLPGFFPEDYPKLISLLEAYFETLELQDNPAEALNDLFFTRDVLQTKDQLVSFLAEELLLGKPYFEGFEDKRTALEFSNLLYRSKGTRYAIQQFFRIFYNTDVDVSFGKDEMFIIGDPVREELRYRSQGLTSGRVFTYVHDGEVVVSALDSDNGVSVLLSEDIDYRLDFSTKSIRLLRPASTNPDYIADSDLSGPARETFKTLAITGYMPENGIIKIEVEKEDFTFIGADVQDKRIQDAAIYQLFSILITSELSVDIWREAYKTFSHPAGMYFGSQVSLEGVVNIGLGSQPSVTADSSAFPVYSVASQDKLAGGYNDISKLSYDSDGYVANTSVIRMPVNLITGLSEITIQGIDTQYNTIDSAQRLQPLTTSRTLSDMSNTIDTMDQQYYEDSDGRLDSAGSLGLV